MLAAPGVPHRVPEVVQTALVSAPTALVRGTISRSSEIASGGGLDELGPWKAEVDLLQLEVLIDLQLEVLSTK